MNSLAIAECIQAEGTEAQRQQSDWLTLDQIASALDRSRRSIQRRLSGVPAELKRTMRQEIGRPLMVYHRTAIPELGKGTQAEGTKAQSQTIFSAEKSQINASDLVTGQLRAEAVLTYEDLKPRLGESAAAEAICAAYAKQPKTREIEINERLSNNNTRQIKRLIILGGFSTGTLRRWARLYQERGRTPLALAPELRGKVGRKPKHVDEHAVNLVHALSVMTPRGTVAGAIPFAKKQYPGDFPDISNATWRRIIDKRDASGAMATLGKYGIPAFRQKHSPVIERDYSKLGYNGLWEIDDFQVDFYVYDTLLQNLIRPWVYAIFRLSTREWISLVITPVKITQAQVESLIGFTMADPRGGIPNVFKFEKGAVACSEKFEGFLKGNFQIEIKRTGMDSGKAHSEAFPDKPAGRARAKGCIERAIRTFHNITSYFPGTFLQTGPQEQHTAPAFLEPLKEKLNKLAQDKEHPFILSVLTPHNWMKIIEESMKLYANTPHSSLPKMIFPSGEGDKFTPRHLTPTEYAAQIAPAGEVRIMPETYIPLFSKTAEKIEVNRNGVRINNVSYGRWDEDMQGLIGRKVTVHTMPNPDKVYVEELGRTVLASTPVLSGEEDEEQIIAQRSAEKKPRNQFEALQSAVRTAGFNATIDKTSIMAGLVPGIKLTTVHSPALDAQMAGVARARKMDEEQKAELNDRLSFPRLEGRAAASLPRRSEGRGPRPAEASERRGLVATLAEKTAELEVWQELKQ